MVQAIIMAGGEGSRLRPLTCDRPKPMVPMVNRPVMEHAVELLKKHGITDIGVTLQYMPQEITNHFGDGSDLGVNMQFFIEDSPLGTAGSVKNASGFINDTFVVVSGDALTDFNLSEAITFHREKGAIATLVLTPVEIPLEYGVVITEKTGEIRQFLEKPGWGEVFSDTVNTGIYILEPEVLDYIPDGQKYDFSQDLFPYLLKANKPLFGMSLRGYWCDIGNLKQYQEAHFAALQGRVAVTLRETAQGEGIFIGENCRIHPRAVLNPPVIIGRNCDIGEGAVVGPEVVIGDNCIIKDYASLKNSVVWNGSFVGRRAEVRGAVLCSKTTVQDRASVFEGSVIGDNCMLEENTRVRPDTKIWPHKILEKDATLNTNLIWGARACRNLFGADGISGKVNINLTPECAAKLGAVYGTLLGNGASVLIGSDRHPSTEMIKSAMQAGLMSVGNTVIDGGSLIGPVHRQAVKALDANGGIYVKANSTEPEKLHINFLSNNGAAITRNMERKMENLFEREDFQRSPKENIGTVAYMPGLTESYVKNLCGLVKSDVIRNNRYRLLAYYTGSNLQEIMPLIFNKLGCELINTAVDAPKESSLNIRSVAEALAPEVANTGATLGLVLDRNAENVVIIDDRGKIIDEDKLLALTSLIIMETAEQPFIVVPITGTSAVDQMAKLRQSKVIRTKTSPVTYIREALKPEVTQSQGSLNQALMTSDAISTIVRILEYMAVKRNSLSEIMDQIPEFHMTRKETDCPWKAKGRVMRKLIEDSSDQQVELLDGVKVYHENGWALVLPDAGEPKYHVYSESSSYEFAEELADFYVDRINELKTE